jgi:hypothetical protein
MRWISSTFNVRIVSNTLLLKFTVMDRSVLWHALNPLAARLPKVVREHEILRVAASVNGKSSAASAAVARKEILRWAQNRSGGRLPEEAWNFQGFEYYSGGRNSAGIQIQDGTSDIWAIRADDPDKTIPGRIWTNEIVIGVLRDQPVRFSVRLLVSTTEASLEITPYTPGFVQQVAEVCGLSRDGYVVAPQPWVIESEDDANNLVGCLLDDRRKLPIFVLTTPEDVEEQRQPLLDAQALTRAVLGMGIVVVLPAALTWSFTRRFGKVRSVFGGAVRAYLPGFTEDANPYAHRLIVADNLATPDSVVQCTRWMRSLAASESIRHAVLGQDVLTFTSIRNGFLSFKQRQLEQEGASESEQLAAAKAQIRALEEQNKQHQDELDYFDAEHQVAVLRAEAAEEQARASAFRIQQLIEQLKEDGTPIHDSISLPETWGDFIDWCDLQLAGRVTLTPRARRGVRAPEFYDVQTAARCLLWLAGDLRDRRLRGGDGSVRDEPVEDGIRNAPCGADQFDLDWQGQRFTAD